MRPPRRVNLASFEIPSHVVALVDLTFVQRYRILPISELGDTLVIAVARPTEREDLKSIAEYFERRVAWVEAAPEDIDRAIEQHFGAEE